jgi:Ca2+-binding EF-hand superfamily protein
VVTALRRDELEAAIQIWKNYLSNKDFIEEKFQKYDTNQSGKLETDQLKALLTGASPVRANLCARWRMYLDEV